MNAPRTLTDHFRDHLFVIAWIAVAVLAKYSVSNPTVEPHSIKKVDPTVATASPGRHLTAAE